MKRSKISQERSKWSLQSEFCVVKSEFVSLKTKRQDETTKEFEWQKNKA